MRMKVIDAVNLCNNSILTQVTVSGNLSNFPLMHNCFKHFYMTNTCRKISPKVFITYTYSPAILTRKIALKTQFGSEVFKRFVFITTDFEDHENKFKNKKILVDEDPLSFLNKL